MLKLEISASIWRFRNNDKVALLLFATRSTSVAKIFESILITHAEVSKAAGIGVPDSIKARSEICFCLLKRRKRKCRARSRFEREYSSRSRQRACSTRNHLGWRRTENAERNVMRRIVRAAYLEEKLGDKFALEIRCRWTKSNARQDRALTRHREQVWLTPCQSCARSACRMKQAANRLCLREFVVKRNSCVGNTCTICRSFKKSSVSRGT